MWQPCDQKILRRNLVVYIGGRDSLSFQLVFGRVPFRVDRYVLSLVLCSELLENVNYTNKEEKLEKLPCF